MHIGNLEGAMDDLQKSINLNDKYPEAQNNFGIVLAAKGDFINALIHLEKAVSLFGQTVNSGSPLRHIALINVLMGDIKSAKWYLKRAKRLESKSPFNIEVEGIINIHLGKFKKAFDILKSLSRSDILVVDNILYLSLSLIFLDNFDTALELIHDGKSSVQSPLILHPFYSHLNILKHKFGKQKEIDEILEILANNDKSN
jgi:tetratricopeptide (TPR) repeat protein